MRALRRTASWLSLCLLVASAGAALNVSHQVLAPADYSQYSSFDVRFGTPAKDVEMRDLIYREAVGHLLSRGLEQDQEEPDFLLVIYAHQVGDSVLGMMQVDIVDGSTETAVWRAEGSDSLSLDKPRKTKRQVKKLISEIFKRFPVQNR
jgi:hypothetical protein